MKQFDPVEQRLAEDMIDDKVADRRRHKKASFRRFEAWIIGAIALAWLGFIAWNWN